jgi:hypothetical protein
VIETQPLNVDEISNDNNTPKKSNFDKTTPQESPPDCTFNPGDRNTLDHGGHSDMVDIDKNQTSNVSSPSSKKAFEKSQTSGSKQPSPTFPTPSSTSSSKFNDFDDPVNFETNRPNTTSSPMTGKGTCKYQFLKF